MARHEDVLVLQLLGENLQCQVEKRASNRDIVSVCTVEVLQALQESLVDTIVDLNSKE